MTQKQTDQALFAAAEAIRAKAYAPYSRFHVGAAILADDGQIYSGCNIENAAYPQGNCAEASAISAMIAGGAKRITRIYVTGPGGAPVTPCGGCRQKLREFAADDCPIAIADMQTQRALHTLGDLLPASFGPHHLSGAPR